jgi:hypothetical protein
MIKVILDKAVRARFDHLDEADLCDESGRIIGHFLSEQSYRRLVYDWANAQVTDEELQRRLNEPGGCTLAEIRAHLENS